MYKFPYSVKPEFLWVLTIVNIYRSMMAVVNLVFTFAMILLAVRFWSDSGLGIQILMSAGMLLFPVFQPLMIYFRCRKIVSTMPKEMEISFDSRGITTSAGGESSLINFSEVKSVVKMFNLMIIYTRSKQGFILNDRDLENQSKNLYSFIQVNIEEKT